MSGGCDVEAMVPSAELVAALVGADGSAPGFEDLLAQVAGWERVISWATACQAALLVGVDQAADVQQYGWNAADAARSLADQVGLALGVSGGSAQRRISTASTLIEKVPAVFAALTTGAITTHHARLASAGAAVLTPPVAEAVAAATMTDPNWRTPSQFAETFARWVLELDAEGAAERHRLARRGRRVSRRSEPEGMGSLWALLPAEDNEAVHRRLEACARSSLATNVIGDERTLDERRADALVQLVCGHIPNGAPTAGTPARTADGGGDDGGGPDGDGVTGDSSTGGDTGHSGDHGTNVTGSTVAGSTVAGTTVVADTATGCTPITHGRHPTITVTVAWSTLIGIDDAPADLAGYGPIDAATARRIAADPTATWRRLLVDPASGRLLDYGRRTYRPPRDLADFVAARDRTCRFPSCDRPAQACDLDHRQDWDHDGATCQDNLDVLCRRHHRLKHQGGWTSLRDPESGDVFWVDPGGTAHYRPATILPTPEPVEPPHAPVPTPRPPAVPHAADLDDDPPF